MPIYEYRCDNGHTFEVMQSMTDDAISSCEECGAPVERVFHPVAVHFKGSGFYTTDYAKKKAPKGGGGSSDSSTDSGSKGEPKSDSKSESASSKSDGKSSD